ncbi:TRAF-type zinc finger-containing protein [Cavenderia fasciculata]|uniref:TRAF-type zinc finger-containing protein n=1 Tax=Cavenderia fasciculata TaxID=261658 RepID=F4PPZ0_CACFS|nr:TRAF-type zinc finger-containing protein [Cavenderia fasciculata]EGG22453.1 TRAF-type zinc finger-containing protein [Cavenderia fasciculata]|eukprot:XP_004360304.1 TRAF-type zinc finger-containing protein [Cavenderia fasciculata]
MADENSIFVESSISMEERLVNQDYTDLTCYLCLGLVFDTRQCSNGHIACLECVKPLTEKVGSKCHCGEPINLQSLSKSLVANNSVKKLEVYCENHFRLINGKWEEYLDQQGCNEITTIEQSESHQKSCPFNKYLCQHDGCDVELVRVELDVHEKGCVHRLVKCDLCQETLKSVNMNGHIVALCPEINEECLNGCGDTYPRKTRDDHIQTCPDQMIGCPFGDEICKEKDKRKYMDAHAQASWHIAQLVIKTNQNNKELKEENDKLNNLIEQLDYDMMVLETQLDLCIKKKSMEWIIPSDPKASTWKSNRFQIRGCTFYLDFGRNLSGAMNWYIFIDKPAAINYTIEVTEKDGPPFTKKKMSKEINRFLQISSMSAFQRKSETKIKLTIGVLSYTKPLPQTY